MYYITNITHICIISNQGSVCYVLKQKKDIINIIKWAFTMSVNCKNVIAYYHLL